MKTFFKSLRIIDGAGGVIEKGWLLIEDNQISEVGEGEPDLKYMGSEQGADITDLAGKTILPGLIDCHVHLSLDGSPDPMTGLTAVHVAAATLKTAANARLTLGAGITTVRDAGSKDFIDIHMRDAVEAGIADGPRMACSGQMICITGGHGHQMGCVADGPDEVRQAVRKQMAAGVSWIKFMATGGVLTRGGKAGVPQLNPDELKAGIEEAHKLGLKTCAHSQSLEGTRNAVFAGIDSVEHGVSLDDAIIEEIIKRGTFLVPTFSAPFNIMTKGVGFGIPAEFVEKTKRLAEDHVAGISRARDAGAKIAMGTDAGTPFNRHGENAFELVYLVENGFSPQDAIICSTSGAAELLGMADTIGTIAAGRRADLMIVDGNPLEDISLLTDKKRIWGVYKDGRNVNGPAQAFH